MASNEFIYYPEINDEDFYKKIYWKKEFNKTASKPNYYQKTPEQVCSRGIFKMQNHQELVKNFISPDTPYNSLILFHGTGVGKTCASIGIAENFREYVAKKGKKIWVIAGGAIIPNFFRELYNDNKALAEYKQYKPYGSFQCAGDNYYAFKDKGITGVSAKSRIDKAKKLVKQFYDFKGRKSLPNLIDIQYKKKEKLTDKEIYEKFNDSVIIVDEAHNDAGKGKATSESRKKSNSNSKSKKQSDDEELSYDLINEGKDDDDFDPKEELVKKKRTEQSKRTLLNVLIDLAEHCRVKIIFLTATPMKDNQDEILDLLEVVNKNDNRLINGEPFNRKKVFDGENVNEKYLSKACKGYISYVRGNNPISFPKALLPAENLYTPSPLYDFNKGEPVIEKYNEHIEETGEFNLYRCEMANYHFKAYLAIKSIPNKKDVANRQTLMISNFAWPFTEATNSDKVIELNDINKDKLHGPKALLNNFEKKHPDLKTSYEGIDGKKYTSQNHTFYEQNTQSLRNFGLFLCQNNPVLNKSHYNLPMFSGKINQLINNINSVNGIHYVYSEFISGGAEPTAMSLEANGFIHFHPNTRFKINGLPQQNVKSRLTQYSLPTDKEEYNESRTFLEKENFRCAVCGRLWIDRFNVNDDGTSWEHTKKADHKFVQATYIIITSQHKSHSIFLEYAIDKSNLLGHKIKAIIGTKVTGEGVDLHWVRGVHILDPWDNNTRIYQAIGRGIRHCSHIELDPAERNVIIYKYCLSAPRINLYLNNDKNYEEIAWESLKELDETTLIHNKVAVGRVIDIMNSTTTEDDLYFSDDDEFNETDVTEEDGNNMLYKYVQIAKAKEFLSETPDERTYRRVFSKDKKVKSIERILKKNAIDCQLNKYINKFPDDEDGTRDCDYQSCDYQCSGNLDTFQVYIRKFKNITDLEANLKETEGDSSGDGDGDGKGDDGEEAEEAYLIKSPTLFEGSNKWHKLEDLKQSETLDNLLGLFKVRNISKLWVSAKKDYITSQPTDMKYQLMDLNIPIGILDESTYNIRFAYPQINSAKIAIRTLFKSGIIYTQDMLVHLVQLKDSLLEKKFIYIALDQLVGKPPYIKPLVVYDKYKRNGNIIYRGKYYIFQPFELEDLHIPLSYRKKPLKIKKQFIKHNPIISGKSSDQKVQLDTEKLDELLIKLQSDRDYLTYEDDEYILYEYYNNLEFLGYHLDRLKPKEQFYIIKKIVKGDLNEPFIRSILEHYSNQYIIFGYKDYIENNGHLMSIYSDTNRPMIYNRKKWVHLEDEQKLEPFIKEGFIEVKDSISIYNNTNESVNVFGFDDIEMVSSLNGIIGMFSESSGGTRKLSSSTLNEVENIFTETLKRLNTNKKTLKFKIINKNKESHDTKKDGSPSKKTNKTGRACETMQSNDLNNLIDNITEVLDNIKIEGIEDYPQTITNSIMVRDIEKFLRIIDMYLLDYYRKKPKERKRLKVFYKPFETELFFHKNV